MLRSSTGIFSAKWHSAKQNPDGERAARIGAAETLVKEAEGKTEGANASFLAAAGVLQGAIAMLQKASGTEDRVRELFRRLKEYETKGVTEQADRRGDRLD